MGKGVNMPWVGEIDPRFNLPWGSKYHMTPGIWVFYNRGFNQSKAVIIFKLGIIIYIDSIQNNCFLYIIPVTKSGFK
jgi:hypothetical protein